MQIYMDVYFTNIYVVLEMRQLRIHSLLNFGLEKYNYLSKRLNSG